MKKKILGIIGIAICAILLLSVAFRLITWSLFWIGILLLAGFAYFVLPRMKE
ncbi:hypothetical protein KY309_01200 [Candidatus Woesearchaeota archaeon]|nr:hypothetical protein [Candidatus Woesearchaeota archaeon]MBW3016210.1 hypothetical protein [Candidatus Woesearchaeota archaeon]